MTNDVNDDAIIEALDHDYVNLKDLVDKDLEVTQQQLADQTTLARHLGEKVAAADKRLADINAALESLLNPLIVAAVDEYMTANVEAEVKDGCDRWLNDSFDITSYEYEIRDMAGEVARDEISDSDVVQQLEIRELVSDILSGAKITGTVEID